MRKERVERNRTRYLGIQSAVLIGGRIWGGVQERLGEARGITFIASRGCSAGAVGGIAGPATDQCVHADKADAIPADQASVGQRADERISHDESMSGTSCGATSSMRIIKPMPQDGQRGAEESCWSGTVVVTL